MWYGTGSDNEKDSVPWKSDQNVSFRDVRKSSLPEVFVILIENESTAMVRSKRGDPRIGGNVLVIPCTKDGIGWCVEITRYAQIGRISTNLWRMLGSPSRLIGIILLVVMKAFLILKRIVIGEKPRHPINRMNIRNPDGNIRKNGGKPIKMWLVVQNLCVVMVSMLMNITHALRSKVMSALCVLVSKYNWIITITCRVDWLLIMTTRLVRRVACCARYVIEESGLSAMTPNYSGRPSRIWQNGSLEHA